MSKNITISVPDDLFEKMGKWKNSLNFSKIFQRAISSEIEKRERFQQKVKEEKSMKQIWNKGNFETENGQFRTGQEFGFAYAQSLSYHDLKSYEEYIEGWHKKDPNIIEQIHYDLNINRVLFQEGYLVEQVQNDSKNQKGIELTNSFYSGVVTGVMEYLLEECSNVEIGKALLKLEMEGIKKIRPSKRK
jgi:hypothetical protein